MDKVTSEPMGPIWARLDRYDQINWLRMSLFLHWNRCAEAMLGQGSGLFLLSRFIETVENRVSGLRLGVKPQNQPAIALYRNLVTKPIRLELADIHK